MSQLGPPFIQRVIGSRIGRVLSVLSLCFVLLVFVPASAHHPQFVDCGPSMEAPYTDTEVLRARPIWVVVIGAAYLPSMLLTSALTAMLRNVFILSCEGTRRVELIVLFVCSSMQWLLVGSGIEFLIYKCEGVLKRERRT
jgi:hypothetical protein